MGVGPNTIAKITASMKELVNPKSIIMFGSHAAGNARSDSDLDLLVVNDSGREKNGRTGNQPSSVPERLWSRHYARES